MKGNVMAEYYNENNLLENDHSFLELDLPQYLQNSIKQLIEGRRKVDSGEKYYQLDMDWDELNADIGTARYYDEITENQAVYLRQKYLL